MNPQRDSGPVKPAALETLTCVSGLYALAPDGRLGVYRNGTEFVVDDELTRTFAVPVRQLLASYLADPLGSACRIGLLYRAPEQRPWDSDTLLLEDDVIRAVYPVGGPPGQGLTAFQKKSREKSIYRGIELLIEYRHDTHVEEPVYFPLLYDRNTMLEQYPSAAEFRGAANVSVPVLEVLNFMAIVPLGRRNAPALAGLIARMRDYVIHKEVRQGRGFTLTNENYVAGQNDGTTTAEFFGADKRHERQQAWPQHLRVIETAQQADRFDQVERWLERPHRPVDPALLRSFIQFRDLDASRLALIVERVLVYTAPGGVPLINIGVRDAWNMYLLEGTVSLQAADGGTLLVTGGSDKAASPISFLKPRKYTVGSVTSVSFLWIHDALLAAVLIPPEPRVRVSALKDFQSKANAR